MKRKMIKILVILDCENDSVDFIAHTAFYTLCTKLNLKNDVLFNISNKNNVLSSASRDDLYSYFIEFIGINSYKNKKFDSSLCKFVEYLNESHDEIYIENNNNLSNSIYSRIVSDYVYDFINRLKRDNTDSETLVIIQRKCRG